MRNALNFTSRNCKASLLIALALAVAGCAPAGGPTPPPVAAAPPPPADPATLGVVGGPLGAKLSAADRKAAGEAQLAAMSDGKRRSWRGKDGGFGFIEPGQAGPGVGGTCRDYTHTIYIDGRPESGKGSACQGAAGVWRIDS